MVTRSALHGIACWSLLFACWGCGSEGGGGSAVENREAKTTEQDVTLRVTDGEGLLAEIAGQHGNVVLVDFWATWCPPCVAQFPHTVELSQQLGPKGLTVISLSLDPPETEDEVLSFLRKRRATFVNLISKYGAGSQSVDEFDLRGDVPLYRLYDGSGKLRHQFSADPEGLASGEPLENLDQRIHELLAEKVTN